MFKPIVSPTLKINAAVLEKQKRGENVYHLGFGESRFPVLDTLKEKLCKHSGMHSYLEGAGLSSLREQFSSILKDHTKINAQSDRIIITPGSKMGIYSLLMMTDGDLLLPSPSWVSYAPQAKMLGKKVVKIETTVEENYFPNAEQLEDSILNAKSKGLNPTILLLNSPNNPTGSMLSLKQIENIVPICKKYNLTLISDEIYGEVAFEKNHISIANYYEKTYVTSGVSKHLSLGGWRVGYILVPECLPEKVDFLKAIASETWSAVPAPIQYALADLFSDYDVVQKHIDKCTFIHKVRVNMVADILRSAGIVISKPEGAFYLYPDFKNQKENLKSKEVYNSLDLATKLEQECNVATLPGVAFGDTEDKLRLRLALSYPDMETDEDSVKFFNSIPDNFNELPEESSNIIRNNSIRLKEAINIIVDWTKN